MYTFCNSDNKLTMHLYYRLKSNKFDRYRAFIIMNCSSFNESSSSSRNKARTYVKPIKILKESSSSLSICGSTQLVCGPQLSIYMCWFVDYRTMGVLFASLS